MDYSNLQSPNRRSYVKKYNSPRPPGAGGIAKTTLPIAPAVETAEFYDSAKTPSNTKSFLLKAIEFLGEFIHRRKLVPIIIDGISYFLSCIAIAIWGLLQIGYCIVKLGFSKNAVAKMNSFFLAIIFQIASFGNTFFNQAFLVSKKILGHSIFTVNVLKDWIDHVLKDWIGQSPKVMTIICDFSLFLIDYLKNVFRRPMIIYRIKSSLILLSVVCLAVTIILASKPIYYQKTLPIVNDASLNLIDPQIALDIAFLKEKIQNLEKQLQQKDEIFKSIVEDFKQTQSLTKSIQLEQEMERHLLEDSLIQLEDSFQKVIEKVSPIDLFMYGPDYSLASTNAFIDIEHTSPSFYPASFIHDFFHISAGSSPDQVLDPSLQPGNCWGLKGKLKHYIYML